MKRIICLIVLFSVKVYAQFPNFEWAIRTGSIDNDELFYSCIDDQNNIYSTGYFQGTVDFDPGSNVFNMGSQSLNSAYVSKFDNNGGFLWAKQFGGQTSNDHAVGLSIVYSNGFLYIVGRFSGTIDFDPSPNVLNFTSNGWNDIFIVKLNVNGDFIWAKQIGGSNDDYALAITHDDNNGLYFTGYFGGTVDFNPGAGIFNLTSINGIDVYICKLNDSGDFVWAKLIGGNNTEIPKGIKFDGQAYIYSIGYFNGVVDFDPSVNTFSLTSTGLYDIYIHKLDTSGNFVWVKQIGGSLNQYGNDITFDNIGNIYITGNFEGTADFDPNAGVLNLTSIGNSDIFIAKFNSTGSILWAKQIGGSSQGHGISISIDNDKNCYTTGYFSGTLDFDPGANTFNLTSSGGNDFFISKLDSNGTYVWASQIGGAGYDYGSSIKIDNSNNIIVAGIFDSTTDFDPSSGVFNLTSAGNSDFFILKLSKCIANSSTHTITSCKAYLWINGITYTESNNTATHTITNASGCDSVIYLNLTIINVDTSIFVSNNNITANAINATFQWLNCENNFSPIIGQTNNSFSPSQNGYYSVEVTQNGCVDTSSCVSIIGVGIQETEKLFITVYPNPSSNTINVFVPKINGEILIDITNIEGKSLYKNITNEVETKIDLNEFSSGLYFLKITANANYVNTFKLIKK
ncbi:MAG: SBBP repeat-containing protein [Bacteroidia bacterium]